MVPSQCHLLYPVACVSVCVRVCTSVCVNQRIVSGVFLYIFERLGLSQSPELTDYLDLPASCGIFLQSHCLEHSHTMPLVLGI